MVEEERDFGAVAGYILDPGILHQCIDARPAEEVALEVITEFEEGCLPEDEAILGQEPQYLPGEDHPGVGGHIVVVQDQNVAEVFKEPFQEFVLELREDRFEEEVFGKVRLCVLGDHDERETFGDPVAVDLFIRGRDLRENEGSMPGGVILPGGLSALPGGEHSFQEAGAAGPGARVYVRSIA